jgi:AmmeMemoRadiSam system protein B
MNDVRPAAVAGMFYSAAPEALAADLRAYLGEAAARGAAAGGSWPKALIVPHAGYVYSGPIAASAYARLAPGRRTIRRVVLFGPAHRVPVRGLALPSAAGFATPLGTVAVDRDAVALALTLPQVRQSDAVHAMEHALEVQIPFLQAVLERFEIVPFAVGDASAEEVAQVIERLWGAEETLIVISSDLSHYHRYADARRIDRASVDNIVRLTPALDHEQACGATPINGLLLCAQRHGLQAALLDLRNSGDTAGDKARVVGYASLAFTEAGHHERQ